MTAEQENGLPPGDEGHLTASGLDESQIDAADLELLHGALRLKAATPDMVCDVYRHSAGFIEPGLLKEQVHGIEPGLEVPASHKLHIVELPHVVKTHKLRLPQAKPRLHKDLPLAWGQPIRRQRIYPGDLPREVGKALYEAMFRKYGEKAKAMDVAAVFAHIPPECAQSIKLEADLGGARFTLPDSLSLRKARSGYYLVVIEQAGGKTRNVLFRLEYQ